MEYEYQELGQSAIQIIDGDRGKNYPNGSDFSPNGYCLFLNAKNVTADGFTFSERMFISEEKDKLLRKGKLQRGDTVLTTRGTVGNVAYFGNNVPYSDIRINSGMVIIRADPDIFESEFIYWLFRSNIVQNQILQLRSGTAQPQLPISSMQRLNIPVPPLDVQKTIVGIIGALQQKIELNRKINENLERQAQTIFTDLYTRANNKALFTDIIQILGGGTPKTGKNSFWNGEIPFFTPKDVGTPYTLTTEKTITPDGLNHCNSQLYPVNTVFVTARGTVGKVSLSGVPMAMNQSCYALVGKGENQLLVYFYTLMAVDRLKHKASGAVFDAITTRDFASEMIHKLSNSETQSFLSVAEPIFKVILSNTIESQRLVELRDTLLPKLISGEIDL